MKRPLQAIVCTGMVVMSAHGMVSTSTASRRTSFATASAGELGVSKERQPLPGTPTSTERNAPKSTEYRYDIHDLDDWDSDDIDMEVTTGSFQELQRSTGSEILDARLQLQIDQASVYPNLFLDAHVSDASYLEKVAMATIPEQLPRPALKALRKAKGLNFSSARVSPEEEIELGKMIQQGVELHRMRSDFETKNGRKPSRTEWAQIAGMHSAKQLRRQVANYRKAKQLLVSANMGLVHAVVKSQLSKIRKSGLSFDELVQEGSLGLLRAAELFDPHRGLRFSTYATIWIKGQLSNSHLMEPIRLPQREKTKLNKIMKAHNDIIEENGGAEEPTVEELANRLGMTVAEVMSTKRKMNQVSQVLSLDYQYSSQSRSGTDTSSSSVMENDINFRADADLAERTQLHADVVAAMARNLDSREGRLMRLRYGLADGRQRSLAECADAMGISQTYAQNIASRCLKKLREAAEAESLEEYLLTVA